MSLKSGKKFSLDDMTAMHEITPIDETPMVKISAEEWERLRKTVEDMEALTRSMMKERKDMYTTSRSHLTRMEKLSNSQIERMNKLTKEAKEVITESQKQVGTFGCLGCTITACPGNSPCSLTRDLYTD